MMMITKVMMVTSFNQYFRREKRKNSFCTSIKNCLITLYCFIKVVSIFVYYSQIIACFCTMGIKVERKFIEHNGLHKQKMITPPCRTDLTNKEIYPSEQEREREREISFHKNKNLPCQT